MGELGQLFEICVFSIFGPKHSSGHATMQHWSTRGHTYLRMSKGTLREHERTCALNAWWAIPLILPSIYLLPPPYSLSYFQYSPSRNGFILLSSRNMQVFAAAVAFLWATLQTNSPLSAGISLAPSFDNLQHWQFIGSILLLYSSSLGKKSREWDIRIKFFFLSERHHWTVGCGDTTKNGWRYHQKEIKITAGICHCPHTQLGIPTWSPVPLFLVIILLTSYLQWQFSPLTFAFPYTSFTCFLSLSYSFFFFF